MRRAFLIALPLAAILTACDGGGDPVQQAVREISAKYQAEAVKEGTESRPASAVAKDQTALRQMIARNNEAIAAAQAVLSSSEDASMRQLAEETIAARKRENETISKSLTSS